MNPYSYQKSINIIIGKSSFILSGYQVYVTVILLCLVVVWYSVKANTNFSPFESMKNIIDKRDNSIFVSLENLWVLNSYFPSRICKPLPHTEEMHRCIERTEIRSTVFHSHGCQALCR